MYLFIVPKVLILYFTRILTFSLKMKEAKSFGLLFVILLLLQSPSVTAEDPFVAKQRVIQKELFDRFTALDRKFNPAKNKESTTAVKPKSPFSKPFVEKPFIDHIAFPQGVRDPFAIPSLLLQSLVAEQNNNGKNLSSNSNFFRNSQLPLPKIKLKGVLHHQNNPSPLAIVLLNEETYMVREGDEIGFNIAEPSQVIKIKKINRLSLLVAIGTLGELVIVR